jgi:hypothetical protein
VLVWLSILGRISHVGASITLKSPHILISADGLIDIARGELVQLLVVAEDDDGDIDGAEDGQLVRLLEQTTFTLEKSSSS